MTETRMYHSPALGGQLRPVPVVETQGNLNALHVFYLEQGVGWEVDEHFAESWDLNDPDVQATLDWVQDG